ncbi:PhzF family phenazine biosynthesis protein [Novosphingobium sp.]|uniref:PhzF family phenazine biosynthesis protein n=1 Tax=Novosphingobium sp. TaxID=1874826 RepID=UPI00273245A3|nr:PhzF family phenazine biosynthesis protein [Novosphingobium sp.]MDP3905633.1 PhzF family phenazine biosynthesis protein [Novosphingobium sp.]
MKLDLVDVFGARAMAGNPLGVVHGADGMSAEAMLQLTRWIGFSECTFLLPPTDPVADYRVRIFYPAGELPFAGHPTLGTAHAWLRAGGQPKRAGVVVQECGVGLVEVRIEADRLAFKAPPLLRDGPLAADERAEVARLTGVAEAAIVDAVHANNGPGWKLLRLRSAADVLAAQPVARAPTGTDVGLVGPHAGADPAWEVRAFFANANGELKEDPVTGSLNAATAQYLFGSGLAQNAYVAGQGQQIGADGRVHCRIEADGAVWIGGRVDTIAAGAALD